jgi:N-acetylglucosaminyl-diphospho-decaprenol L-rhamnosyltransferase
MPDLAIIIVTWNVRDLALQALTSLYADLATSGLTYRVVVVDSASQDDTVAAIRAAFPQVELIASAENLGFGRANNAGMRHVGFVTPPPNPETLSQTTSALGKKSNTSPPLLVERGQGGEVDSLPRAVYLLNPDTITQPGATRALFDALFAQDDVGMVGARLTYGDGSFQHGAFAFPGLRQLWTEFFWVPGRFIEHPFNGRYPRDLYDAGTPFDVDFTLGATMLLRREVIQQTGMFDEGFFMYAEEVDWAWRMHKAGWRVQCVPAAQVVHLAGQSTSQVKPRSLVNLWESRLRLLHKHLPSWKVWLAKRLIAAGMRRKIRELDAASGYTDETRAAVRAAYEQIIALTTSDLVRYKTMSGERHDL